MKTGTFYIGNLSYEATEQDLRALFENEGFTVTNARVCTERDTGRKRGFGFVDVSGDASEVPSLLDGKEHMGRNLRVREAEDKPPQRRDDRQPSGRRGRQSDRDLID